MHLKIGDMPIKGGRIGEDGDLFLVNCETFGGGRFVYDGASRFVLEYAVLWNGSPHHRAWRIHDSNFAIQTLLDLVQ